MPQIIIRCRYQKFLRCIGTIIVLTMCTINLNMLRVLHKYYHAYTYEINLGDEPQGWLSSTEKSEQEPNYNQLRSETNYLAIASVCVDEGNNLAPDKQVNTARDYMNWTMSNHKAYADAHGYAYHPLTHRSSQLPNKDVRYHKLIWVKLLLQNYSWIFFTDCDSIFLDYSIDVGRWATRHENSKTELILTGDHNYAMNSGQFLIRNRTWAKSLLDDATKEPIHTHGCMGNDNAAFNWLLWRDCSRTGAKGRFATAWNNTKL